MHALPAACRKTSQSRNVKLLKPSANFCKRSPMPSILYPTSCTRFSLDPPHGPRAQAKQPISLPSPACMPARPTDRLPGVPSSAFSNVALCLCLCFCQCLCLSTRLSVCPSRCPCLSASLCFSLSVVRCLFLFLFVYLFVYLFVCVFV